MRFEKWQALGNDYLIVERDELPFELTPARVRRLCDGHFGVFADGVLLLSEPADPQHVADLRIFNPDGSEAELSGNGAREAILYLRRRGWTDEDTLLDRHRRRADPPDDHRPGQLPRRHGPAQPDLRGLPRRPAGRPRRARASDGRTHVALPARLDRQPPVRDPRRRPRRSSRRSTWPRSARRSKRPALPQPHERLLVHRARDAGTGRRAIRARIFERGVGETLSSGTGASGAAVAYARGRGRPRPGRPRAVVVLLDGGELEVEVGEDLQRDLTGWARPVFEGQPQRGASQKELHETE